MVISIRYIINMSFIINQIDGCRHNPQTHPTYSQTHFNGLQDSMQRFTLAALSKSLSSSSSNTPSSILEVTAGKGFVATFMGDNYCDAHMAETDPIPYYLDDARKVHTD